MTPRLKELYFKKIQPSLKEKFAFKNAYMSPQLQKVVINMGLGLDGNDSKIIKSCEQDIANIAGQKPVITAVNGHAFAGGIGLIGASDIVITDEDAIFSFSEVRLGLIPAIISVVCLPKLGIHHGTRLFLTGERFNGTDAANYGLAHHAVPKDRLMSTVQEMINALGYCAPTALIECKRLVRRMSELSVDDGFREALPWSKKMFDAPEGLEGMAAFKEKRLPKWVKQ